MLSQPQPKEYRSKDSFWYPDGVQAAKMPVKHHVLQVETLTMPICVRTVLSCNTQLHELNDDDDDDNGKFGTPFDAQALGTKHTSNGFPMQ